MFRLTRSIFLLALLLPVTIGYGKEQVKEPESKKKKAPLIPNHSFPPDVSAEEKSNSQTLYAEGLKLQKQKKLALAIAKWKEALAVDPRNVKCLNHYAWFKGVTAPDEQRDLDLSLKLAQQAALASNLTNHDVLDTVAEIHFHRKEYSKAIAIQKRALACSPISKSKRRYLDKQLKKFEAALESKQLDESVKKKTIDTDAKTDADTTKNSSD